MSGAPAETVSGYSAEIVTESVGIRPDHRTVGVLTSAGKAVRIDYRDESEITSSIIQTEDGRHVVLNHRLSTFYSPKLPMGAGATARLAQPPWGLTSSAKLQLGSLDFLERVGRDQIDGRSADLHQLTMSFTVTDKVEGEKLTASVSVRLEFWTTTELTPPLYAIDPTNFVTGFPQVDKRVRETLSRTGGTVMRLRAEITRSISGGVPSTGVITTSISNIRVARVPVQAFDVPEQYRFAEPIYRVPR